MKSRYISIIIALVIINVALAWQVLAGSLDSPAAPASTSSYGLDDIYNRLNTGAAGTSSVFAEPVAGPGSMMNTLNEIMAVAPITKTNGATKTQVISGTTFWGLTSGQWGVQTGTLTVSGGGTVTTTYIPQTGQTKCYDTSAEITCGNVTYPGQDGDYQKGVAWPDPRFITSTTGIVTDTLTGLIWLQDANCIQNEYPGFDVDGRVSWTNALTFVFKINDGIYPNCGAGFTDWRLPNVRELSSLTHFEFFNSAVPNTAGTAKWTTNGDPFNSVQTSVYWSSSTRAGLTAYAWYVYMNAGSVDGTLKSSSNYVWPVRGGQ